jgi:hypothetical protein
MRYSVISGGPAKTAAEAVENLQGRINEALRAGAALFGGVSVAFGKAPGIWDKPAYEAFQAVMFSD